MSFLRNIFQRFVENPGRRPVVRRSVFEEADMVKKPVGKVPLKGVRLKRRK